MLTLACALSAALMGGLALAYTMFVWTHGNGFRRWMRWLAPLWAALAFYYAFIWTWDTLADQAVNTVQWLRPTAWAVWLLPAITLLNSLREDTRHRDQERHAETQLAQIAEGLRHGKP